MSAARTEGPRSRQPGDRVAKKLELITHVGEGGMGSIWVAKNLTTEARVAIKVLRAHREDDGHAAERFRHEARVGATLAHRNITRVFDLLEDDDGSLVLVMELLHGDTLEALYKAHGTLPCREAVEIIVPVLGALQHAHDHGVVHRDVKPSNIFMHVDPDGHTTPKLLDFGIAKTVDASVLTRTGEALGSPSYMSPEQVRAMKQLDPRSDVFSVGVVLYEIITGENPFHAPSPTAMLARVLELEVDPDPRIEPRVWLEIQRALAKQAYERHPSANSFADALARAVGLERKVSASVRQLATATPAGIEIPRADARHIDARRSDARRIEEARTSPPQPRPSANEPDALGALAAESSPRAEPTPADGSSWKRMAIAAAVLVIVALVFVLRSAVPRGAAPDENARAAPAPTTTASASPTATATATATATPAVATAAVTTPEDTAAPVPSSSTVSPATAATARRPPSPKAPPAKAPPPASSIVPSVARTPGF